MDLVECWAAHVYAAFLRENASVETEGIWCSGHDLYLVVKDPSAAAIDGSPLQAWVDAHCPAGGIRIEIVGTVPAGATRLADPSPADDLYDFGAARPLWVAANDLEVELGPAFPPFRVRDGLAPATIDVETSRALGSEEDAALKAACTRLGIPASISTGSWSPPSARPLANQALSLESGATVRRSNFSRAVQQLYEADEDFWRTTRERVLSSPSAPQPRELLPDGWDAKTSRCLVPASVFPPSNIRTHLSMFGNVTIVAPLGEAQAQVLAALGVSEDELVTLATMGRVQLIFPQPLGRYSPTLLDRVCAEAPGGVLLSRRLASLTLADARRRMALFMPPGRTDIQRELIAALLEAGESIEDPQPRAQWRPFVSDLATAWSSLVVNISKRGAMGTARAGIGGFAAALLKHFLGQDLALEFENAGAGVEWAGAVGAVIFPVYTPTYSELAHTNLLCELYSGVPVGLPPNMVPNAEAAIRGILTVAAEVPVVEFAKAFGGGDIERFRQFIFQFIHHNYDSEKLEEALRNFNTTVNQYERKASRLEEWNIEGVIGQAADLIPLPAVPQLIRAALWVHSVGQKKRAKSAWIGSLMDSFTAGSFTPPEAVLVARMKRTASSK